jgi:hypothetical protein
MATFYPPAQASVIGPMHQYQWTFWPSLFYKLNVLGITEPMTFDYTNAFTIKWAVKF